MTVHETLKAMRELLADEKRWTQKVYARAYGGVPVWSSDARAVCWCLIGACNKVSGSTISSLTLAETLDCDPGAFNDSHTHAEVIAKLDDAIKATAP